MILHSIKEYNGVRHYHITEDLILKAEIVDIILPIVIIVATIIMVIIILYNIKKEIPTFWSNWEVFPKWLRRLFIAVLILTAPLIFVPDSNLFIVPLLFIVLVQLSGWIVRGAKE